MDAKSQLPAPSSPPGHANPKHLHTLPSICWGHSHPLVEHHWLSSTPFHENVPLESSTISYQWVPWTELSALQAILHYQYEQHTHKWGLFHERKTDIKFLQFLSHNVLVFLGGNQILSSRWVVSKFVCTLESSRDFYTHQRPWDTPEHAIKISWEQHTGITKFWRSHGISNV